MSDTKTSAAHIPLIAFALALVVAVILGIGTGSINEHTLQRPIAQPGDKITVP